jgi:diguanylate cyclase (GGDEF)-like protein
MPSCLETMQAADFGPAIALYHVRAQCSATILGQYREALDAATAAAAYLPHTMATPLEATHHFYRALAAAALAQPLDDPAGAEALLHDALARYRLWAQHSPVNFQHRLELLQAEAARLAGELQQAMRAYAAAIDSARAGGFLHEQALAAERAAQFYEHLDLARLASVYRSDARAAYQRWGASAKLRALDAQDRSVDGTEVLSPHEIASGLAQFDLIGAVKASHAVSQELVLDRLVANLLDIALQHAGADRGLLVLMRDGRWQIEAQASAADRRIEVELIRSVPDPSQLPLTVLHYVGRMREAVLLNDASQAPVGRDRLSAEPIAPAAAADPYVLAAHPRSLLCLPLLKQTRLVGALYLENKLAAGVFTRERIALLELLASQAAISLENATLFQALQDENRERQRVEAELKRYGERLEALVAERTAELEGKHDELAKAYRALDDQAVRDPLTGLHNRRFLMRCVGSDVSETLNAYHRHTQSAAPPPPLADLLFLLIDIDHFKQINDTHGHSAGDSVLVEMAKRLRALIRDADYVVRWGGEEFLVVCRNAERAMLSELAERLRAELSDRPYVTDNGSVLRISCSIGATGFPLIPDAPDACDWERAIDLADRALYATKLSGRNGWVVLNGCAGTSRQTLLDGVRQDTRAALADRLIEVHTSVGDPQRLQWRSR